MKNIVQIIATRCYIPQDDILHIHRCENLKSYVIIYIDGLIFQGFVLFVVLRHNMGAAHDGKR
jgi:hypothetical protein